MLQRAPTLATTMLWHKHIKAQRVFCECSLDQGDDMAVQLNSLQVAWLQWLGNTSAALLLYFAAIAEHMFWRCQCVGGAVSVLVVLGQFLDQSWALVLKAYQATKEQASQGQKVLHLVWTECHLHLQDAKICKIGSFLQQQCGQV